MTNHDLTAIPRGYCGCGCGQQTRIATRNHAARGWVKGEPLRFVHPHQLRHAAEPEEDRFWSRVGMGHPDGCWVWTGALSKGYGRFSSAPGRCVPAHRFAYELLVGPVPGNLQLDHLCRNRACVNPDHLEPVTNRENVIRGNGPTAENARKTHCPEGHGYDEANTYVARDGRRVCRACNSAKQRRYRNRQSAAAAVSP